VIDGEWMEALLVELVETPTELGHEEPGQAIMARAFGECGLEPRDIVLDARALRDHAHASPFTWEVSDKRNVAATWHGTGGGRSLILGGHIDVVPPADAGLWTHPPYRPVRDGDWLYGRGAGDMKAGLVAMTGAVRALREAGYSPAGDVHLLSVVEEECTGNGALQCLIDGVAADACVLTEPHPDHLTIAQVGVLWFHVDIHGAPAHAARMALGHNAIEAAYEVLAELRALERELNAAPPPPFDAFEHPINLNPGIIAGGDWTSTVAAQCTLSCRLACYPGDDPYDLRERIEAAVAHAAGDGFMAAVRYDGFTCEGATVSPDEPLVEVLSDAYAAVHGQRPALEATTATTDARHFVRAGIPAVCFGPRAEQIHGVDERVSIASMTDCARVLAEFTTAWCGS
jgi:acetylornithine deacetylase